MWLHHYLKLRHGYWYRWAHKPLCTNFQNETFRLKGVYLCRSCTLLVSGAIISCFILLKPQVYLAAMLIVGVSSFIYPYHLIHRYGRDILRFGAGLLLTQTILLAASHFFFSAFSAMTFVAGAMIYLKKRKKYKLDICSHCPEYKLNRICSGYEKQFNSIRIIDHHLTCKAYEKRGHSHVY